MKEGWIYKKLGEVCEVTDYVANGSFATLRANVNYKHEKDFAILVRLADFTNNFDSSKFIYIDKHAYTFLSKSKLYGGEIIMSNVGSLGKEFICPNLGMPMSLGPNSIVIKSQNNKFYYYVFKSSSFQEKIQSISSITALPKFNKTQFKEIIIPVPSSEVQNQIVSELDLLSGVIEKQKAQIEELDNLAQSIFYDMFGDPVTNEKGWEVKELRNLGEFGRGVSKHRPRNAPELLGGKMPLVQTGDVANADMYITSYTSTYSELGVSQSKVWKAGTICITIAANIGNCSILSFDACFPDSVVGFVVKNDVSNNEYIYYIFRRLQSILESNAPAVAQKNINLKILDDLSIPLPPLSLQQEFAAKIEAIEAMKAKVRQSLKESEKLFNSRMDYYFN